MLNLPNFRWPFREDRAFSAISLLVLVVPLAFSLKTYENFETIKFSLIFLFLGWALWEFFKKSQAAGAWNFQLNKKFAFLLLGFLLFGMLSALFGSDPLTSFFGLYTRYTGGWIFYFTMGVLLLLLAGTLSEEKYRFLIKILIVDALLIAVYGILQSMGWGLYNGIEASALTRSPSFVGNPNFSSLFLAVVLPFSLIFAFGSLGVWSKVYYATISVLMIWALVVFSSRGAWLGAIISLIAMAVISLWGRLERKYFVGTILGLLLGGVLYFGFVNLVRPQAVSSGLPGAGADQNVNLRFYAWDVARLAIMEKPFLGVGLSNFVEYYELKRGKHLADQPQAFDDPHNLFLYQAASGGLPFAVFFWLMVVMAFFYSGRMFLKARDPLLAALLASLLAWSVAVSFTPVPIPAFVILMVLLTGPFLYSENKLSINFSKKRSLSGRSIGAVFLVFGLAFIVSEHIFYQGYQAYLEKRFEDSLKYSSLAHKIFPLNRIYLTYRIGSEIKLYKDAPFVLDKIAEFERADSIKSLLSSAHFYMLLYLETKNLSYGQAATDRLEEALKRNPNHAERHARLAFYYFELGNFEQALFYVNNSLSQNSQFFPAWMLKAKLHQAKGEKTQTINALERVAKQFPEDLRLKKLIRDIKAIEDIKIQPIIIGANYDRLE